MDIPQFAYSLNADGLSGSFQFRFKINKAARNILVQVRLWTCVVIFSYFIGVELLVSTVSVYLTI